jgi:hypothetical protein
MKKYLTLLLLFITLAAARAVTFDITFAWDANLAADNVTKYTLYQADGLTGVFVKVADVAAPTLTCTVPALTPGVYQFYVTATNMWGESDPSNTVTTPAGPASAPRGITIRITAKTP